MRLVFVNIPAALASSSRLRNGETLIADGPEVFSVNVGAVLEGDWVTMAEGRGVVVDCIKVLVGGEEVLVGGREVLVGGGEVLVGGGEVLVGV